MTFNSTIFLFAFLPVLVLVNLVLKREMRNIWLLLASVLFYGWAQPQFLWLLFANILINYCLGLVVKRSRLLLALGVILNLSALAYFKYANFMIDNLNRILHGNIGLLEIMLPIGISFYTFKGISYLADIWHERIEPQRNFIHVAVYIGMFPEIMSGPIERYGSIEQEIKGREVTYEDLVAGVERFIIGLAKKAILADSLGAMVDMIWSQGAGSNTVAVAWLGSIAYTLQIFFDFAGYSDMAIGIGRMLGFHLAENFNLPYISKTVGEFWRRWHITLGAFFRDYVYIPLGGNRRRVYLNLAIVFVLTGLWHGAAWNYILWGCMHGFFMLVERFFRKPKAKKGQPGSEKKSAGAVLLGCLSNLYTLFVVNIGWVLFRADGMTHALQYLKSMVGRVTDAPSGLSLSFYLGRWNVFVLILAVVFSTAVPTRLAGIFKEKTSETAFTLIKHLVLLALFVFAAMQVMTSTYQSFIYFQF